MVCSNCKQEGHTKPKCKNPKYVSPPESVLSEEPSTPILLTEDIKRKFARLSDLSKEVAAGLGKGHVEGVYQQALIMELQEAGIRYVSEETMPILYKGRPIGGCHSQRLDVALLSYLPFIFELKAVSKPISSEHHWQLVRYLDYKKQPYGAVVNFNQSDKGSLEIQFIVKQDDVFYLYDPETSTGSELSDFGLVKTAEEWGWE
jgi:GxxExxY protein